MEIDDVALPPQLTLTQAFDTLTKIKKTATGPRWHSLLGVERLFRHTISCRYEYMEHVSAKSCLSSGGRGPGKKQMSAPFLKSIHL